MKATAVKHTVRLLALGVALGLLLYVGYIALGMLP